MSSNTGTALRAAATGQVSNPVATFSSFLDKLKPQMALALPKHMSADRMARLALTAFSSNPDMQACNPKTIAASLMTAGAMGLEPGVNGAGYLIPYKGTCTFVPGWKGLVDLVSRSGRATVWTGAVFEGDHFEYALGDRPFVQHRPGDETDPDKLTHVYAIGRVNGSDYPVIEVWSMRKVWKHRDKLNKQGGKHYSYRHPEMYARKVPLLQVLKYLPSSIEIGNAVAVAEAAEAGRGAVIEGNFVMINDDPADQDAGEIRRDPPPPATAPREATPPAARTEPPIDLAPGPDDDDGLAKSQLGQPATFNAAAYTDKLKACSSIDALDVLADELRAVPDDDIRGALTTVYRARRQELATAAAKPTATGQAQGVAPLSRRRQAPE